MALTPGGVYDSSVYDTATYDAPAGTLLVELLINGAWQVITPYVRVSSGVQIQRGRQDEQAAPQAATCRLTLDNSDGRFTPRYTSGAYYPYLTRNTQLRVSTFMDDGTSTVRFWGAVSSWPLNFDLSGNDFYVPIQADGYRRRLAIAGTPLDSPYTQFMKASSTLTAYWPMEDGASAAPNTAFVSAVSNGTPALEAGASFASDTSFTASAALPTWPSTASMRAVVPTHTPSALGEQVRWLMKAGGTSNGSWVVQVDTSGAHYFWLIMIAATASVQLYMFNYVTGALEGTGGALGVTLTAAHRMSVDFVQSGANINTTVIQLPAGSTTGTFQSDTFAAATLGRVTGVRLFSANALPDGTAFGGSAAGTPDVLTFGQVSMENTISSIFDSGAALVGYAGETAGDRWVRIVTQQGLAATIVGGTGTAQLGPQGDMTPLQVLDEAADADDAISTELVNAYGLKFRARSDMYSQAAAAVSLSLVKMDHVSPIDDDQQLSNDVTVSRPGGASARAVAATGLTPAVVGTYADSLSLNLYADSQLADQAGWRMTVGSVDKPRWQVGFNALNMVAIDRAALVSMREGDLVQLGSLPAKYGGTGADPMMVLGWTETITVATWDFVINAGPASPWNEVFILDSATYGILDTDRLGM